MPRIAPGLYQYDSGRSRLTVSNIEPRGGGLYAWIEVEAGGRLVHAGRYDLQGPRTPPSIASAVSENDDEKKAWKEFVFNRIISIVHDHLAGDPPRKATPKLRSEEDAWLIRGFWRTAKATSLVGFGESAKSFLAQAAAVSVCTGRALLSLAVRQAGPVLYLDWEGDDQEFDHRLAQLVAGMRMDPPDNLLHKRPGAFLHRSVLPLQRYIAQEGVVALIVDSVGYARSTDTGGDPQGPSMLMYQALDQLGIPALLVDHRAKHAKVTDYTPLGAVANYNSLRLLWQVTPSQTRTGMSIRLRCGKCNYGPRPNDLAWNLDFPSEGEARFTQRNPQTIAALEDLSLGERLHRLLLDAGLAGATTIQLCVDSLSSDSTVRKALSRLKEEGRVRKEGSVWIAVLEDRQEVF